MPFLISIPPPLEMKGRVYTSCVRSSMIYGNETRPLLADVGLKFERAELQMINTNNQIYLKSNIQYIESNKFSGVYTKWAV